MDYEKLFISAVNSGIIDLPTLQKQVEMNERRKYLEQHEQKVWQGKDGFWCTYLPDDTKGRRLIRKTNRKSVDDAIVSYYKEIEFNPSVEYIFKQWINEKLEYEEITKQTYDRYISDFERFFDNEHTKLSAARIKNVSEDDLEKFIKTNIVKLKLSHKSFCGMRLLVNGIFKYAKKHGYTDISVTNFFGDMQISRKSFTKVIKDKSQEVFLDDEIPVILNYLNANNDIFNLGIELAFYTGMRVGELSALKYSDLSKKILKETKEVKYVLAVRRTEVKIKDEHGHWTLIIQDHPKTESGYRDIIVNQKVVDIIEAVHGLNPFGEYLFMNDGIRVRGNKFNKRLGVICEKLNMPHRTMHKIRKTYGTTLLDSNMDESLVAMQMGHSDVSTTRKYYYFSNKQEKTQVEQVINALSNIG